MKRTVVFLAAICCLALCPAHADYAVWPTGAWPKSWPSELEPLRKQSSSIQGSKADLATHHLPFTKREDFESAWPHLLAAKTKGAPIILVASPSEHWHFGSTTAGVLMHAPPEGTEPSEPGGPIDERTNPRDRWLRTTYIELVVDGAIVDLNRIQLPVNTPIFDERFKQSQDKSTKPAGD